jgi:putative DNA primase/helicase
MATRKTGAEAGRVSHDQNLENAIRNAGFEPPDHIEPGRVTRFPTSGKNSDKAGWIYLFPGCDGAVFGDWRAGQEFTWQATREKPLSAAEQAEFERKSREARTKAVEDRERGYREAAIKAATGFNGYHPAPADNAYLVTKGARPHSARQAPDGRLAIPVYGRDGNIQSLQFIAEDGAKRFFPGGKIAGGHWWLGDPNHASTVILLAEGFATAASLHQSTGHPCYIAFSAGNLAAVARIVAEKHPGATVIICGDDDTQTPGNPGKTKAEEAAKAIGAKVVFPKGGGDFNDLAAVAGPEAVKATVEAVLQVTTEADILSDYIHVAALYGMTFSREWIAEGFVERGRVYEWFGKWKNGKTIAVIDMACHSAIGRVWAGRKTVQTLIVWVAGESCEDVQRRLAAWMIRHKVTEQMPFYIRTKPVHINVEAFAARLAIEIEALKAKHPGLPVLLVIDTVARSLSPDCNENSIEGLGAFANNIIDHVVRPTGCAAICVHHSGHGDSERSRGWSGFAAALDGSVKVEMQKQAGGPSTLTVSSVVMRSGAGDDALQFRVDTQEIPGQDNFGNQLSEPVLCYLGAPEAKPKEPTGKAQKTLMAVLKRLSKNQPGFRVGYQNFRNECLKGDADGKMSASTFSDALKKLVADGLIERDGPEVLIPEDGCSEGVTKFRIPKGISEFSERNPPGNTERNLRKDTFSEFSEHPESINPAEDNGGMAAEWRNKEEPRMVSCWSCAYWNGQCRKGREVSDPAAKKECSDFKPRNPGAETAGENWGEI